MTPGELWRRLRFLLRRDRFREELEEEMRLHQELRAEAKSSVWHVPSDGGGRQPPGVRESRSRRRGESGRLGCPLARCAAKAALERLADLGIVTESTGRRRDRLYTYKKQLTILDRGTA